MDDTSCDVDIPDGQYLTEWTLTIKTKYREQGKLISFNKYHDNKYLASNNDNS